MYLLIVKVYTNFGILTNAITADPFAIVPKWYLNKTPIACKDGLLIEEGVVKYQNPIAEPIQNSSNANINSVVHSIPIMKIQNVRRISFKSMYSICWKTWDFSSSNIFKNKLKY